MPQPTDRLEAPRLLGDRQHAPRQAGRGWSPRRQLAVIALLAVGSWAGLVALGFAAVRLVEWEAVGGLLRFVPLI